jgi:hypothetical protein
VFIALAALAIIALAVYFILHYTPQREPDAAKPRKTKEYALNESPMEKRLFLGDSIVVPYNGEEYQFILANVGEALTIASPNGDVLLDLGQEITVDADGDGFNELRITAADFVKNKSATGARLRFELDSTPPPVGEQGAVSENTGTVPVSNIAAVVIFSSPNPYPFTLQVSFQNYCLFRYEILAERDKQGRNEGYYERTSKELSIPAQNGVRLGVSNAAAAKIQVIGGGRTVDLELGGAGEVVVAEVHWIKDDENRYRLVFTRLEQ